MPPTELQRRAILQMVEQCRREFLLMQWTIGVVFSVHSSEEDIGGGLCRDHDAEVLIDEKYLRISITFFGHFYTLSEQEQLRTIRHELGHWITRKLRSAALGRRRKFSEVDDADDEAVEIICNIVTEMAEEIGRLRKTRQRKGEKAKP
jgi:hypothetical protein